MAPAVVVVTVECLVAIVAHLEKEPVGTEKLPDPYVFSGPQSFSIFTPILTTSSVARGKDLSGGN